MMMNAFLLICSLLVAGVLYGQQPTLIVPVGHTDDIHAIDISSDSKYVLTSSVDQTTCVWETGSGRLLFNIKEPHVTDAKFSHNGKIILTVINDSIVKLWDAFSGKQKSVLQLKSYGYDVAYRVNFSRDDKHLFVNSTAGLTVYDTASMQPIYVLQENKVIISAMGKIIVSAPGKGVAKIGTITEKNGFPRSNTFKLVATGKGFDDISISPNDKYLLTEGLINFKDYVKVYEIATGKLLYDLGPFKDWEKDAVFSSRGTYVITAHGTVDIWNASNGALLHSLSSPKGFRNATMSNDESYIVTLEDSAGPKIWNVSTGSLLRVLDFNQHHFEYGYGSQIEWSQGDKYIVATNGDYGKATIWDAFGRIIYHAEDDQVNTKMRPRTTFAPVQVKSSTDGRYIAIAKFNNAKIWDAKYNRFIGLQAVAKAPYKSIFSPDGNYMATLYSDSTATMREVASGKILYQLKEQQISTVAFSNDGTMVTLSAAGNAPRSWNVTDGSFLYSLKGNGVFNSVSFSADGKKIITAEDSTIKIWEPGTGILEKVIPTPEAYPGQVAGISPDETMVVASRGERWDLSTAKQLSSIPIDTNINAHGMRSGQFWNFFPGGKMCFSADGKKAVAIHAHYSYGRGMEGIGIIDLATGALTYLPDTAFQWSLSPQALDVQFSPDGKEISVICSNGIVKTWNIFTQKMKSFSLRQSYTHACFSPGGQYIVTASPDYTAKVIETTSRKLLYSFVSMDSTDYLAIDTAGRYEGTEGARKLLYYACGHEIIELEQLKQLTWEPDLVSKIMRDGADATYSTKPGTANFCGNTPQVEQPIIRDNVYHFKVTPRMGGIGEIFLYVGGKHVKTYHPDTLKDEAGSYSIAVNPKDLEEYFVPGKENSITVKAATADNQIFSKGQQINVTDKRDSLTGNVHLFCVSVGISKYKGERLKLHFASRDATDVEQAITASYRKMLEKDGKDHVTSFMLNTDHASPDHLPLKENIRKAFEEIATKATASDILLVFLSGHGTLGTNKLFYFLTQQASSIDLAGVEKEVAISSDELNEWMRKVKAQKQVLILDACHSGQALQDMIVRKNLGGDQQRALEKLKDMTGTYLLSASTSEQVALEMGLYNRGLLAHSLLLGMKTREGLKNNYVEIGPWFQFAADKVKELAKDATRKQDPQLSTSGSFPIGIVDDELTNQIKLETKKPQFKRSNFQNKDLFIDDLKIGLAIDSQLNELTFTGADRPLVFFNDATGADVFSINGQYENKNNRISGEVRLFKGTTSIVNIPVRSTTSNIEELVKQVISKVLETINNL